MPKFAANLSFLYSDLDFLGRFAAAARSGFKGVEYLFPYAFPKERIAEALQANNLKQVLHNLPGGKWDAGERGIGCHPDRISEFKEGVDQAIEYAKALQCDQINCLAGIAPPGVAAPKAHDTLVENLKYAAPRLEAHNIKLLIEPINIYDIPGFFLPTSAQALALMDEAREPNLYLQYDIYHMQMMEGNLADTMAKNLQRIAHVQVADVPGRHEPGTGEIRYDFLFQQLEKIGYTGWIGCEYKPLKTTEEGLVWMTSATPALSRT
jgi:hydroxypyruvate isomerase